ncbi:MAG TPA: S8 family serine peptidase, partial [Chitinophagaceae bacterium]|nr:S8 family serine peptidase [Chitinophagaceae bacterium]
MRPNPIPLTAVLSFLCISSIAQQQDPYLLQLNTGSFVPEKNITTEKIDTLNLRASRSAGKTFTIIQFESIPTEDDRKQLQQAGIELLDYIPNNAYTATISGSLNITLLKQVKARAIVYPTPEQKMQPDLAKGYFPSWSVKVTGTLDVWISFPKTFSFETVSSELKKKNFDIISTTFKSYRVIALRISTQRIQELASLPYIEYVQPAPHEDQSLNHQSIPNARANVLNSDIPGGRNLKGDSVVIGIGDDADPLQHIDFTGRLIDRSAVSGNFHGVHVTGIAAGAGLVRERFKGYAPKATIVSQLFSNIYAFAPEYVQDYGMVITNNSYGNIVNDCNYHGTYDLYSRILDQQAIDLPELQQVFAAGNSGSNNCSPYPPGFRTVLGSYQSAKNVISVGNTSELRVINSSSSKGPVRDGRIKPEITAQGSRVFSTTPINSYGFNTGTSMSSPAVAGGLALLYQRYRQLHSGANPKNALMKALICNGGTDLGNTGPDFTYGFGWMNLLRSVQMLENNNYYDSSISTGATKSQIITVPANTAQLKVMLYWNDPPAAALASKTLVNDLDLQVIGIAS